MGFSWARYFLLSVTAQHKKAGKRPDVADISAVWLVCVDEKVGLNLMQSYIPKIDFLATSSIIIVTSPSIQLWENVIIKYLKCAVNSYTTDKGRNGVYYLPA